MAVNKRGSFRQRHPRHSAEVTSDRLADALDKWPDEFDGEQRDMVAVIRYVLERIAEKEKASHAG